MSKRELNKAEQEYIRNNYTNMTAEELSKDMNGIGPKTVQKFIEEMDTSAQVSKTETVGEMHDRLNEQAKGDNKSVQRLLARDPEKGIVMMTEGASAMIDARRSIMVPHSQEKIRKSNKIYIMDKSKKCR